MAAQEIKVPDIGDFDSVEVIEVLVSKGDTIEQEQPLITLESDKATLEVPSTIAGKITEMKVSEGDNVSEGDVIALVEAADEDDDSDDDDDGEADDAEAGDDAADDGDESEDDAEEQNDDSDADESADAQEDDTDDEDAGGETIEVKVPDIGDFDAVEVIEVLVAEGDEVEEEQPLITLESDKATLEVPSSAAGKITEMKVSEGDTVSEGDVIAMLEKAGGESSGGDKKKSSKQDKASSKKSGDGDRAKKDNKSDKKDDKAGKKKSEDKSSKKDDAPKKQAAKDDSGDSSKLENVDEERFGKAHASPSVRKYARELGADLGHVDGSGRKGRITVEDVQSYVKKALSQAQSGGGASAPAGGGGSVPAQPDIDFSQFGEVETVELARIRKMSAKAVHKNWLLIPHVTQFDNADITDLEDFRQANKEKAKAEGVKLTPLAFLLKASAAALKAFPDLNSSLTADGEHLVHKKYVNIAVAVDTPNGLLMPVVKDVDKKGIYEIARDLDDVSTRAREGKIKGDDMKGACFSISSLGGVGGTAFTPIVNSPEVGILGVSKHSMQPVWNGSEFEPRLILPLSFSYDHRVIDGAKAARITGFLSEKLSDLRTLLL
ncbi:pyruvate dehydrogenase E2 component dihydrolipoamide acetyltransferase protein [Salinisphaera shabanensis E1L3A]|uniref:Acetyltransferase component of pyruvate dehydrogenase complex n=1 Tax=Salinisphaera shabanensis E1L3A TaxID=1033802 RepID=U2ER99_9GAMM|nr:dihydrolipoyllysine-residue acetyltransferase [Salinisphaera shabanensis]ERJ20285.1 pyruvate dehydrogenase E2 component dihydrolipoamide acetyltransferase protein [Salinisphaera shabanensis E1L3A]